MKEKYDVIIIGTGAAGMTAAVFAGRRGARVCVIEHRSEPGKKILQTGNGRCNLTHEDVSAGDYRLGDAKSTFLEKAFAGFGYRDTIDFFASIGIPVRNKGAYIYPYSGTALSVRNALWDEMKRVGADIFTDARADIVRKKNIFFVNVTVKRKRDGGETEESYELEANSLILATGLKAAPKTGSDGSGIDIAKRLGLRVNPVLPSLVKLKCAGDICKVASGVRHASVVQIYVNESSVAKDTGEVQFTDDGVSGIPVFNVSRYASVALHDGKRVKLILDLLPDYSAEECREYTDRYYESMKMRKISSFFGGFLPGKLLAAVSRSLSISADRRAEETGKEKLTKLILQCKTWTLDVTDVYGFEQAQVCTGGVDTSLINPKTMQVNDVPGLFVAGELADIDGPCGGYNLQWAWTSGALAGKEISL